MIARLCPARAAVGCPAVPHVASAPPRLLLLRCRYTSLPERQGDQEENPSAATPHFNPMEQQRSNAARRQHDADDTERVMGLLHDIECAAVASNPGEAGHPENHRVLDAADYPPPAPRPVPEVTGFEGWRPEHQAGGTQDGPGNTYEDDTATLVSWWENP